jgi:hypothetical protein
MEAKSSFFTQEMHCKGVHAWPILGPSLTLINIMPLYERPQSHESLVELFPLPSSTPFSTIGVAGPTSLCSTIVLDSCSSFVVFTAQRNAQLRTTTNVDFSSLPHRIVRSWSSRMGCT